LVFFGGKNEEGITKWMDGNGRGGDMWKKTKHEEWEELIVGRMKGGESNEGRARFM
jgi:hypothetical protein